MIQAFIPYNSKGLKQAYNQCFNLLPSPEDWAVLCDRDILWFQSDFINWIEDYVNLYPDAGMFTCYASRCSYQWQIRRGTLDTLDMSYHVRQAKEIEKLHPQVKEMDGNIAGHVIVIQKKTWLRLWPELESTPTIKNHDILGVDTLISKWMHANNLKIYLMRGLYVYHLFRLNTPNPNRSIEHLNKIEQTLHIITPCSRPENLEAISKTIPKWAKWWIIYDRNSPIGITENEFRHDTTNTWGKAQINFALDQIPLGDYCYVLDDDNILHPDFEDIVKPYLKAKNYDWIGFNSTERAYRCEINQIDQAQFIWKNNGQKYPLEYNGDGQFAVKYNKANPIIIERILSYYNKLRP